MFKYTTSTLKKLEDLFSQGGYVIRYERGNFQAGYCILESKSVVVINKYFTTDARINCLIEILPDLAIKREQLDEVSRSFLNKVLVERE